MKKIIILLFVVFVIPIHIFSQSNFNSKTKATSVIETNYIFRYLYNPIDTVTNINSFIDDVNKIVAIDSVSRLHLGTVIFSAIQQEAEKMSRNHILGIMPINVVPNIIPVMGINANDIIKNNFSISDYEKIYESLLKERIVSYDAYKYLARIYQEESYFEKRDMPMVSYANPIALLDMMFKDYGVFSYTNRFKEEENKTEILPYKPLEKFDTDTVAYLGYNFIENKQKYLGQNFIDFFNDIKLPVSYVLSYGYNTICGVKLYFTKKNMLRNDSITKYAILVVDFHRVTDDHIEFETQKTVEDGFPKEQIQYLQKRTIQDIRMYIKR